jgi:hypothetical protein
MPTARNTHLSARASRWLIQPVRRRIFRLQVILIVLKGLISTFLPQRQIRFYQVDVTAKIVSCIHEFLSSDLVQDIGYDD